MSDRYDAWEHTQIVGAAARRERPPYLYHQHQVSPFVALGELVFLAAVLGAIWRRNR